MLLFIAFLFNYLVVSLLEKLLSYNIFAHRQFANCPGDTETANVCRDGSGRNSQPFG